MFDRAASAVPELEPALMDRIARSITSALHPVRPMAPTWVLASGVVLICTLVVLGDAARMGFYGFGKLSGFERVAIFSALGVFIWLAATEFVGEMIPGSKRWLSPHVLLGASGLGLLGVFALLFHDYHTHHFVKIGMLCLLNGLAHAAPAGLLSWWLLRRGFALNSVAAGVAGGLVGGLAGVALLELHCSNFEALHVMLWHTAVIPVSGAAGALLARTTRSTGALGRS
jgi:hypothetical protein